MQRYALVRLPHHDRYLNTPVEPMHLVKNIGEHIVKLLSGVTDNSKVREEKQRNGFPEAWLSDSIENEKITLPPAPFVPSKEEQDIANNRVMSITMPHGLDWKQKKLFRRNGFGQIKSVEWKHALTCGIIKYSIKDLMGDQQRSTLFELCDVLTLVTSDTLSLNELDMIELQVHRVLSLLERDFPVSLHVVVFHLLHHLPKYLRRFGPVHGYHMFPMERFNSWIKQRVTNRRYPESTVLESYRLFELTFFFFR